MDTKIEADPIHNTCLTVQQKGSKSPFNISQIQGVRVSGKQESP